MQAKKFLGGQDWIRARTALYDFYNRDALAQQRRCIIPQQVSPPWSCPPKICKGSPFEAEMALSWSLHLSCTTSTTTMRSRNSAAASSPSWCASEVRPLCLQCGALLIACENRHGGFGILLKLCLRSSSAALPADTLPPPHLFLCGTSKPSGAFVYCPVEGCRVLQGMHALWRELQTDGELCRRWRMCCGAWIASL